MRFEQSHRNSDGGSRSPAPFHRVLPAGTAGGSTKPTGSVLTERSTTSVLTGETTTGNPMDRRLFIRYRHALTSDYRDQPELDSRRARWYPFGVRPRLIARTRPLTSRTVSPKVSCSGREIRYRSRPADNRLALGLRHRPGDRLPRRGSHRLGDPGRLAELRMIQPAFLTTWRGEVCERAVRTRREPGGGKRRAQRGLQGFSRITSHESRPFLSRAPTVGW